MTPAYSNTGTRATYTPVRYFNDSVLQLGRAPACTHDLAIAQVAAAASPAAPSAVHRATPTVPHTLSSQDDQPESDQHHKLSIPQRQETTQRTHSHLLTV